MYVFMVPFLDELYESDGCHLYSIDMVTGEKEDLGLVVEGRKAASFWFYIDNNGNVWFTLWKRNYAYANDRDIARIHSAGAGLQYHGWVGGFFPHALRQRCFAVPAVQRP